MNVAVQVGEELTNTQFVELLRSGRPVHLQACTIKGKVDLNYGRLPVHIVCEDCSFDSQFFAVEARFARSVSFARCQFKGGIDWTGAHVDGGLRLSGSYIAVAESLTPAERWPASIIEPPTQSQRAGLARMRIGGPFELDEVVVDGTLDLEGIKIEGSLRLRGAQIAGRLNARLSRIEGEFDLEALSPGTTTNGSISGLKATRIGGDCIVSSAKLGGHVILNGASIGGHLRFTSSHISGWIMMRPAEHLDESGTQDVPQFPRVGRPLTDGKGFWLGAINLASAIVNGNLELSGAELHGALCLDHAEVKKDIELFAPRYGQEVQPCQIRGDSDFSIDATALTVEGSVRTFSIQCESGICLDGARIGGELIVNGTFPYDAKSGEGYTPARVGTNPMRHSIRGRSSRIGGAISLKGLDCSGFVEFSNAWFGTTFSVAPLYGYSGEVVEDVSCTRLRGGLVLEHCEIASHANLRLSRINEPKAVPQGFLCPGIRIWKTRISGQMSAAGLLLHGSLDAEGAEIADSLDLSGAIITGDVKIGDAKLGTSLVFGNEPERFDPRLAQLGTWIGGGLIAPKLVVGTNFYLLRCSIGNEAAAKEEADLAELGLAERRGKARHQLTAPPPDFFSEKLAVEITGARVGGDLIMSSDFYVTSNAIPKFALVLGGHLDGRALHVGGQCRLLGVEVRGDLRLPDSQIGGGFELVGTVVFGDLDMRGAEIRGEIFSSSRVEKGFQVPQEVSPIVTGQVLLTRARVRVLRLHFIAPEDGVEPPITLPTSVDLEHAEIGELIVSGQLRARKDPKFRFSGLRFDEINVDDLKAIDSGNPFVRLLDQTDPYKFNEGFYLQVEKWLRERGKDKEADDVYLALRQRGLDLDRQGLLRSERLGHPVKWLGDLFLYLGRSVLFHTVADGVRVTRLFLLWVLALVCSILLFSRRESVQHPSSFTPKSEYEEAIIAKSQSPSRWAAKTKVFWTLEMGEPDSWRWTDGMWVALRVHVPLVELFARNDWVPSERRIQPMPIFYETYASYMRMFSVIALPLMLTAATGLLKRK
jgi:hypothetical protein